MGKSQDIDELTNLMSVALRHRVGSLVNENEFYAARYAKDADHIMKQAEKVLLRHNWNSEDKKLIKELLHKKLYKELEEKEFIDNKKFQIMDYEIDKALKQFNL